MRFYRAYAFDLDGTLFRGNQVIPGAVEVLQGLRDRGARIAFATNNSSLTVDEFVAKLTGMGFAATAEEVFSSGSVAADYCLAHGLMRVFVVGEPGLIQTLESRGLTVVSLDDALSAHAVVSGICRDALSYTLLDTAMQVIRSGVPYIATNTDGSYPMEGGKFSPGSGAIVAFLRTCSEVDPVVMGKPQAAMLQAVVDRFGIAKEDLVMVGDRVDTDIDCGTNFGCDAILVQTGVDSVAPNAVAVIETLSELLEL